ncbi:MAG: RNA polymerase sigma-70 factor [uncultured Thermomicrobiales bacterium]|uniref:RNA polymerase sigma-70 factor n=1 Tax=uncultured Thermomicrobiales bacterium TaxID=1645740 RepID=A0A6J4TX59_9BACT|nr:MAG: RNA polymerase sigma-70 factor [uncultured Thermomicrobiales bacterium]
MTTEETYAENRGRLFAIAYRMLGSAAEAEDVVQEAFVRWSTAIAEGTEVREPRAWLTTVTTRLAIDVLRDARVRRETYVGPWLPEPVATDGEAALDPGESVALAESLSVAFLVLLETLTPTERAAFLLHDVFAYPYAEVADVVGMPESTCRQLARRARARIAERRPRFAPPPAAAERLTASFIRACTSGDLDALRTLLADDVTFWSDGGGRAPAPRRPITGADRVARALVGLASSAKVPISSLPTRLNGQAGFVSVVEGMPFGAVTLDFAGERIVGIRLVVNPDKLGAVSGDVPEDVG